MGGRGEGRSSEEMERTLYVANLDDRVTDEILYELMVQAGPVANVARPKDRPYAFIIFEHEESIPYAIALFRNVRLFGRQIDMKPREGTQQARKINAYMESARRMKGADNGNFNPRGPRHPMMDIRPPVPQFWSSSMNLAAAAYGHERMPDMVPMHHRSFSWPKFMNTPPMEVYPLEPPPLPPPLPPAPRSAPNEDRNKRDRGRYRDYEDQDDPNRRSQGTNLDSRRRSRSRSRDRNDSNRKRYRK